MAHVPTLFFLNSDSLSIHSRFNPLFFIACNPATGCAILKAFPLKTPAELAPSTACPVLSFSFSTGLDCCCRELRTIPFIKAELLTSIDGAVRFFGIVEEEATLAPEEEDEEMGFMDTEDEDVDVKASFIIVSPLTRDDAWSGTTAVWRELGTAASLAIGAEEGNTDEFKVYG